MGQRIIKIARENIAQSQRIGHWRIQGDGAGVVGVIQRILLSNAGAVADPDQVDFVGAHGLPHGIQIGEVLQSLGRYLGAFPVSEQASAELASLAHAGYRTAVDAINM